MKQRVLNVLISLDQLAFSLITLGKANPDETISAASWRWEQEGRIQGRILRPLIDKLFFFDPEHCRTSFESEIQGKQLPEIYNSLRKENCH